MNKYAFGIDIGGTTIKIGLFDTEGTFVEKWEIPTRKDDGGVLILPDIAQSIKDHMSQRNITFKEVIGAGVGVPGPVLADGTVNGCVNLGWGVMNVGKELSLFLDNIPVSVGNDANVAALGEQWRGGGQGHDNVIMVTLGTGVGGGIILNGHILTGVHGAAGEIGHIHMKDGEDLACGCGNHGCLEQYASATGVARRAKEALAKGDTKSSLSSLENVTAKDVFDVARTGDQLALDLVDETGHLLGEAISYLTLTIDPDLVVIGGGVSKAGQILIDAITKHYKPLAFHATRATEFKLATLGNDAGMYGAVRMALLP